ncbi:aspartyl protease family A01A [Thraustotheca clavata]|uniref:Aspartyl protease family A01A n=1 Tax=Thraustotheca clavata TaxID=74557 RepID=A0A1V9YFN0_9STRA|nr:aspartyl protease family A01A [Thraustotheca clavata]
MPFTGLVDGDICTPNPFQYSKRALLHRGTLSFRHPLVEASFYRFCFVVMLHIGAMVALVLVMYDDSTTRGLTDLYFMDCSTLCCFTAIAVIAFVASSWYYLSMEVWLEYSFYTIAVLALGGVISTIVQIQGWICVKLRQKLKKLREAKLGEQTERDATAAQLACATRVGVYSEVVQSVFVIQREALAKDELIRQKLCDAGYRILEQTLLNLTAEKAAIYYHEKLNFRDMETKRTARNSTTPRDTTSKQLTPRDKTPRNEVASPRDKTPRHQGDWTPEAELPQDAINALSSGPIVVLVLEKHNGVKDLLDLVGSSDASQWSSTPTTLRAQFGKNQQHIGIRCSKYASNVLDERDFLLGILYSSVCIHFMSKANSTSRCDTKGEQTDGNNSREAKVSLDALMDFLFPPKVQHLNSTGRLFVFSLYGPLDSKSRLRSGEKGLHGVTDLELNTMSQSIEREDILSVYGMIGLSRDEEEEVLRQADKYLKIIPRYTRRDVEEIFSHIPRDEDGKMRIMEERLQRVLCMKEKLSTRLAAPIISKYRKSLSSSSMTAKYYVAPPSMFLKDAGLNGSENAVLISRLLNCHSFQICHLNEGNSPDLTQNVRLLRQDVRQNKVDWNSNHAYVKNE